MDRSTAKRLLILASRITAGGAAAIALLELTRILFRNHQLFLPSRIPLTTWNPADYGLDSARVDDLQFEAVDGSTLHGWYCRAEKPIASMLYCHGNRGNLTLSAASIARLNRAGLNVLVFDYRGFGKSSGRPTLAGVVLDAIAAAALHDSIRPVTLPSVLYGYSLGGAIAAQLVKEAAFSGLILQSTFTNLADMARVRFPNTPLHVVSKHEFDTYAVVQGLKIPVLIMHGTRDEVVPPWMGESLSKACPTAKIELVSNAMHTDLYERQGEGVIAAVRSFAENLPLSPPVASHFAPSKLHKVMRLFRKRQPALTLATNAAS